MKRFITIGVLLFSVAVFANEGKILFEKKCASCHIPYIPMLKLKENFEHNNTILHLKAPTLNQLSYRLKKRIGDPKGDEEIHRMEVGAFVSDYVLHPDRDKSVCLDEVLQSFKTMPSLKGKVSEEELEEIATYLYDFEKRIIASKSVTYEGFEQALKDAKKSHKLIMIEAMSEHCHYCKKMQREVLVEEEVVKALQKDFVSVIIDVKKARLPLGLKAQVTPTFIFLDENGRVLLNVPGAWGKADFLEMLSEAKTKAKEIDEKDSH